MMEVVVVGVVVADDDNDDDDRRRFAETLLSSSVGNCSVDALELRKLETSSCLRAFCDVVEVEPASATSADPRAVLFLPIGIG